MARTLSGRTALITGAGKRVGRAIALALAREGVDVVAHYHSSVRETETLIAECMALGVQAQSIRADLRDPAQAEALPAQAIDLMGSLDIVVNNASIFPEDRLETFTAESLEHNVRVNALAPALITRALARLCASGDVVNLLDARMDAADPAHVSYHLSKRMFYSYTRLMAIEYAPRLRVNAVAPGLVLPPEGKDESYLESLKHTNALQTYGNPSDIVEAVLYLLRAEFTTGQVIYVDGGRHLTGGMYG